VSDTEDAGSNASGFDYVRLAQARCDHDEGGRYMPSCCHLALKGVASTAQRIGWARKYSETRARHVFRDSHAAGARVGSGAICEV
jgi:hypothetical protein